MGVGNKKLYGILISEMKGAAKKLDKDESDEKSENGVRPFLKWAGGKGKLLKELITRVPPNFNHYFEPFLGGGALFFKLLPEHSTLSDTNEELINCYNAVRHAPRKLLSELKKHAFTEEYFYQMRDLDRMPTFGKISSIKRASRLIYLNKTCYNGLYRVNSKGQFNVPFGSYKNPTLVDSENLLACSKALTTANLLCESYLGVEKRAQRGDFVYFDPPYAPLSDTSNFTNYSKDGFSSDDQKELMELCSRLDARGVFFMLSNSSAPLILNLYSRFNISLIDAPRAINSNGAKRGPVKEVIVTNYPTLSGGNRSSKNKRIP